MDTSIIWWSAIIGGSLDTVKQLVADGTNPLQTLNGQTAEEAVWSFSHRLQRMSSQCDASELAQIERVARYSELISFLQISSKRYLANMTRRSFLRHWVRFHRRERTIRECIWCIKVFSVGTDHCMKMGPLEIMLRCLSPSPLPPI